MSVDVSVRLLTPRGLGGIAVMELTGTAAEEMLRGCFRAAGRSGATLEPGRLYYGHILRNGELLDEVLVCRVPTEQGESVFEINCHGGVLPAFRIAEHFIEQGAREGRQSELLQGRRLRKLERELLEQLIHARTHRAADVLLVQLSGRLRAELREIGSLGARSEARRRVRKLRATYAYGRRLVEPATVVITGAPNVGKSTLANALVGRERSIVHHLPGTTRDAVTSVASLEGLPVIVVDTAGLREASDEIERMGVEKALEKVAASELAVWVFDHSRRVTPEERTYLKVLGNLPVIPVVNKIDLDGPLDETELRATLGRHASGDLGVDVLRTCALAGVGIAELRRTVLRLLVGDKVPAPDAAVVTAARVASVLDEATARLEQGRMMTDVLDELLEKRS